MAVNNILSPSLFAVLINQAADGNLRPASLIANVQAGMPITYQSVKAEFEKESPGNYIVRMYKDNNQIGEEPASTPVEAKMMVLDYLIAHAQQKQPN